MEIKEIEYGTFGKCLSITNGTIKAIVTIDVGPRIISFSRCDAEEEGNIFFEDIERKHCAKGKNFDQLYGEGACHFAYGGHRLWLSPEDYANTCYPDNRPVVYSLTEEGVNFMAPQEQRSVQTSITLSMGETGSSMMVIHTGTNHSQDLQTCSLWGITMLRKGGFAVVPQNPRSDGNLLLPNRQISLWPYTDLQDPRLYIGNRFVTLRQMPVDFSHSKLKIGLDCHSGWCLYQSGSLVFAKRFVHNVNAAYPDGGVSFEGYITGDAMNLETLSPLYRIAPGDTIRHVESFSLLVQPETVLPDVRNEDDIARWVDELEF